MKLGGLLDTSSPVCGFTVVGSFCHKILTLLLFVWDISMDEGCLKWHRFVESATRIGAKEAQVEAPCAISKLLFYGKRFCALVHVFTLFSVLRILEVSFFPGVSYQTLNLSWVVNHQVMAWFFVFKLHGSMFHKVDQFSYYYKHLVQIIKGWHFFVHSLMAPCLARLTDWTLQLQPSCCSACWTCMEFSEHVKVSEFKTMLNTQTYVFLSCGRMWSAMYVPPCMCAQT